ncbi:class I SAM-dependent DNA methyltransferase [Roseobacteraceae bacterium S113]
MAQIWRASCEGCKGKPFGFGWGMEKKPDLHSAYALETPEDNLRLYADWAASYDADFADATGYRLPGAVAQAYQSCGGQGPVLDVGAGTGLVGKALARLDVGPVDGTDLSQEMLDIAAMKGFYARLFRADITQPLDIPDAHYAGAVSAGTFTHGHVGPGPVAELLRVIRPGGWLVVSVNASHWERQGFDAALAAMAPLIDHQTRPRMEIYAGDAPEGHAQDEAILLHIRRA